MLVKLGHSVRAHSDPLFQELQTIVRMNPYELRNSDETKTRFVQLCNEVLTFAESWESPQLTSGTQRMYPTKKPQKQAAMQYIESCMREFTDNQTPYLVSEAYDMQRLANGRGEFYPAGHESTRAALDKGVKEQRTLLFWKGKDHTDKQITF